MYYKFIHCFSSSSSDEDEEGSSAENLNDNNTNAPNQNNSQIQTSIPKFTGANNTTNISINPVMKSSSNPNVDKTAMGITSSTFHLALFHTFHLYYLTHTCRSNVVLISSGTSSPKQSIDETNNCNQPTMWLGTEDGCIHVYNCSDNIRIKKNKVKIQHASGVHCIVYV